MRRFLASLPRFIFSLAPIAFINLCKCIFPNLRWFYFDGLDYCRAAPDTPNRNRCYNDFQNAHSKSQGIDRRIVRRWYGDWLLKRNRRNRRHDYRCSRGGDNRRSFLPPPPTPPPPPPPTRPAQPAQRPAPQKTPKAKPPPPRPPPMRWP